MEESKPSCDRSARSSNGGFPRSSVRSQGPQRSHDANGVTGANRGRFGECRHIPRDLPPLGAVACLPYVLTYGIIDRWIRRRSIFRPSYGARSPTMLAVCSGRKLRSYVRRSQPTWVPRRDQKRLSLERATTVSGTELQAKATCASVSERHDYAGHVCDSILSAFNVRGRQLDRDGDRAPFP